ncbi:hypothetical protein KJ693_05755 [bacterium]|nr:hypothetical protein [bacterium]MBU1614804.1 hypothetical protein [bacterium]
MSEALAMAVKWSPKAENELISLTEECAKVTEIPYLMNAYCQETESILAG